MLAGPMSIDWLPNTKIGRMVGDYVGVTYTAGKAFPAISVARANNGSTFDEAIYSTTSPLMQARGVQAMQRLRPLPGAHSDHPPREFYDEEGRYPESHRSGNVNAQLLCGRWTTGAINGALSGLELLERTAPWWSRASLQAGMRTKPQEVAHRQRRPRFVT